MCGLVCGFVLCLLSGGWRRAGGGSVIMGFGLEGCVFTLRGGRSAGCRYRGAFVFASSSHDYDLRRPLRLFKAEQDRTLRRYPSAGRYLAAQGRDTAGIKSYRASLTQGPKVNEGGQGCECPSLLYPRSVWYLQRRLRGRRAVREQRQLCKRR